MCGIIGFMHLEIASFRVTDVRFGTATALRDGVLSLDRGALATHLLEDSRLSRAGIEIARPGESARIIHVLDAVEPRIKVAGGPDFPGILGRPELVGGGRTHRLDGVAVLSTCDVPGATDSQGLKEAIIDLAGPGAPYTPFGRTMNVVLELAVRPGLPVPEAVAAVFIAAATRGSAPDHTETLGLGPVDAGLPRVAYVMPTMSEGEVHTTFFYGRSVQPLPAVVHPNEVLDGGLVSADYWIAGHRSPTYLYQNEPVIRALYRRHGRDLNFAAVLLCRCLIIAEDDKLRQAVQAAKVARMLDLQGAMITMSNGGHAYVDQMLLCQQLEQAGVATVLGVDEYSDTDGRDFPLVTYVPEARAIVSVGNQEEIVEWPAVQRVLGGSRFLAGNLQEKGFQRSPAEPLRVALRQVYASTNQLGWSTFRGRAY
jgi:glycine reductase